MDEPAERGGSPERPARPQLLVRLQERKARHKRRGILFRAGNVGAGLVVVLVGVVLSSPGVPGPGLLLILTGLGLLALEFDRAERLLERAILWADAVRRRAERATPRERAVANLAGLIAVAAIVAAILLWDIPLLPL